MAKSKTKYYLGYLPLENVRDWRIFTESQLLDYIQNGEDMDNETFQQVAPGGKKFKVKKISKEKLSDLLVEIK